MKILYLTNLKNGWPDEDRYLINLLEKDFEVTFCHQLECQRYLSIVDGIAVRNIWPTHEYRNEWIELETQITKLTVPVYNSLMGKGDNQGKGYLIDLYARSLPVIPSINQVRDLHTLPESEFFWVKPKVGCDGFGACKVTKQELLEMDIKDSIIQPYIEFVSEPSFFFVDNTFAYAITMPNRLIDGDIALYEPTEDDLLFAQKFVEWNALPHGVQRIDAVRTKEGKLLLTEVEDIAPYLYLLDIDSKIRERVSYQIIQSVTSCFSSGPVDNK